MAEEEQAKTDCSPHLPVILLLQPPTGSLGEQLSRRFRLLKPWEAEDGVDEASGEPSDAFLARHADAVRSAVCFPGCGVSARLLALLPRLECVVTPSMGVNHIDMAECQRRGVAVANAGAVFCADTADYAVGLLIDVLRRVSAADRYVRSGRWPQQGKFPLGSKVDPHLLFVSRSPNIIGA
ncbi:hypothetical protein Taro_019902 [Colocasia esculenta]|uniref:D-isomer specific 2-hydroxyacid dehydrogenase catalytic domain-containing protein n=1 Tax=Colocasia esculenta TaxID=4460 RepID=A0A843UV17_COLES|nr:hypothetical protein [Colocasia esculenta]